MQENKHPLDNKLKNRISEFRPAVEEDDWISVQRKYQEALKRKKRRMLIWIILPFVLLPGIIGLIINNEQLITDNGQLTIDHKKNNEKIIQNEEFNEKKRDLNSWKENPVKESDSKITDKELSEQKLLSDDAETKNNKSAESRKITTNSKRFPENNLKNSINGKSDNKFIPIDESDNNRKVQPDKASSENNINSESAITKNQDDSDNKNQTGSDNSSEKINLKNDDKIVSDENNELKSAIDSIKNTEEIIAKNDSLQLNKDSNILSENSEEKKAEPKVNTSPLRFKIGYIGSVDQVKAWPKPPLNSNYSQHDGLGQSHSVLLGADIKNIGIESGFGIETKEQKGSVVRSIPVYDKIPVLYPDSTVAGYFYIWLQDSTFASSYTVQNTYFKIPLALTYSINLTEKFKLNVKTGAEYLMHRSSTGSSHPSDSQYLRPLLKDHFQGRIAIGASYEFLPGLHFSVMPGYSMSLSPVSSNIFSVRRYHTWNLNFGIYYSLDPKSLRKKRL